MWVNSFPKLAQVDPPANYNRTLKYFHDVKLYSEELLYFSKPFLIQLYFLLPLIQSPQETLLVLLSQVHGSQVLYLLWLVIFLFP